MPAVINPIRDYQMLSWATEAGNLKNSICVAITSRTDVEGVVVVPPNKAFGRLIPSTDDRYIMLSKAKIELLLEPGTHEQGVYSWTTTVRPNGNLRIRTARYRGLTEPLSKFTLTVDHRLLPDLRAMFAAAAAGKNLPTTTVAERQRVQRFAAASNDVVPLEQTLIAPRHAG